MRVKPDEQAIRGEPARQRESLEWRGHSWVRLEGQNADLPQKAGSELAAMIRREGAQPVVFDALGDVVQGGPAISCCARSVPGVWG